MNWLEQLFRRTKSFSAAPSKPVKTLKLNLEEKEKENGIDKKYFFDSIRSEGLFKKLSQSQVDGLNYIIDGWNKSGLTDLRWFAYMLATTYHETARTMQPIAEYGKGKRRPYGKKIKMSRQRYTHPNKIYYGRGFVQLTWYENYDKMSKLLGIDLLNNPELAMVPEHAMQIMIEGMTKGASNRGDFTGRSLEQYFNSTSDDPEGARRIINGRDKAKTIAKYHYKFRRSLRESI